MEHELFNVMEEGFQGATWSGASATELNLVLPHPANTAKYRLAEQVRGTSCRVKEHADADVHLCFEILPPFLPC